ncbi:MAG TPA: hypothetical protein VLA66_01600 [Thermoanaerobaculia bacterium]|nr:hypothetical protein [Thermoanaerobaculia bacterium]
MTRARTAIQAGVAGQPRRSTAQPTSPALNASRASCTAVKRARLRAAGAWERNVQRRFQTQLQRMPSP